MIKPVLISFVITLSAGLVLIHLSSCQYDQADVLYPLPVTISCDTTQVDYVQEIKPILTKNCTNQGCHVNGAVFGGFKFDSYSETIKAVPGNKLLHAVKHISGGSKNMPPSAKMPACEINQIEAWIRIGSPEN